MKDGSFPAIPLGVFDPRVLPRHAVQYAVRQLTVVDLQRMALYGPSPRRALIPALCAASQPRFPYGKQAFQVLRFTFPTRACPLSGSFQPLE